MYIKEKKEDYTIIRNGKANAEIELTNISELSNILNECISSGEKNILVDFKNIIYIQLFGHLSLYHNCRYGFSSFY